MEISQQEYEGRQNGVMNLRLETEQQLFKMKLFLMGKKQQIKKIASGDSIIEEVELVPIGKPKLNDEGVNAIMEWMSTHIDPALVQGNLEKWDDLKEFMYYFRQDFADIMTVNMFNWDIQESNYSQIIDPIVNMTRLFLSRTVGNLERESYTHTLRTMENTKLQTEDNTKKGWSLFGNSSRG